MVSEDGADGLHGLLGERRHQLADGGPEHFHHRATRNSKMNDGSLLGLGLNDLWCRYHGWSPVSCRSRLLAQFMASSRTKLASMPRSISERQCAVSDRSA